MKDKKPLDWIPIYIDKHLFGSTRLELEPDERSVWMDLLVLSGKDEGFVRANEGIPYPPAQLAGMFVISEKLLERTVTKCTSKKIKKIVIQKDGTMYIPSWKDYKLSLRHKRRFEPVSAETDIVSPKAASIDKSKSKSNSKSKEEEKDPPHLRIKFNFKKKQWQGILDEDLNHWKKIFPDVDIEYHVFTKMVEWIILNPRKGRKKNYARFINNWLSDEQDKFDLKNAGKRRDEERAKEWLKEDD